MQASDNLICYVANYISQYLLKDKLNRLSLIERHLSFEQKKNMASDLSLIDVLTNSNVNEQFTGPITCRLPT